MATAYERFSWRGMARDLAGRLANYAYCEAHPLGQADPVNCPFCHDRSVYLTWQAAEARAVRR
jgi:hypothetical protein